MNATIRRFKLIKKIKTIKQEELHQRTSKIDQQINHKETSIQRFEQYLSEYQEKMLANNSLNRLNFVNFQLFLQQIVNVLDKERQELNLLVTKNRQLKTELMHRLQQIKLLQETIDQLLYSQQSSFR